MEFKDISELSFCVSNTKCNIEEIASYIGFSISRVSNINRAYEENNMWRI